MNLFNLIRTHPRKPRPRSRPQPRPVSRPGKPRHTRGGRPGFAFEAMEPRVLMSADGVSEPVSPGNGGGLHVASGDVSGDGIPDLIVVDEPNGIIAILIGQVQGEEGGGLWNVAGGDEAPTIFVGKMKQVSDGVRVATGDVNNDGFADVIVFDETRGIIAILGDHSETATLKDGTSNTFFATTDALSAGQEKLAAYLLPYMEQENLYSGFKLVEVGTA